MNSLFFATELIRKLNIPVHIADDASLNTIDGGIRGLLYANNDYTTFLKHSLSDIKDNIIYRYVDEYLCCYIAFKIPTENKYFFAGPYLLEMPDNEFFVRKFDSFGYTDELKKQIEKYYINLPLVEDESFLISIVSTLGISLWGDENSFVFEYMEDIYLDNIDPTNIPEENPVLIDSAFHLEILETNYNNEKIMMDAVSSGRYQSVSSVPSSVFNNGTENRLPDSLRNRKNYLIIFNTLLRKAAEQGGVHPLHIDKISSLYAKKIEDIHSTEESLRLQGEMMKEYCYLVKKHSLSGYSTLVGKAITIIDYDLAADLSLKNLAAQLFVNASHLSNVFSKELGQTLTEYVNERRIERAVKMIHKTNMQIQDIAISVGITDINYFIRLFKKKYGITPTAYRKQIGK